MDEISQEQKDENARAIAWQLQQQRRREWQIENYRSRLRGNPARLRELMWNIDPPLRRPENTNG